VISCARTAAEEGQPIGVAQADLVSRCGWVADRAGDWGEGDPVADRWVGYE
jgi:hypothetical protein